MIADGCEIEERACLVWDAAGFGLAFDKDWFGRVSADLDLRIPRHSANWHWSFVF